MIKSLKNGVKPTSGLGKKIRKEAEISVKKKSEIKD